MESSLDKSFLEGLKLIEKQSGRGLLRELTDLFLTNTTQRMSKIQTGLSTGDFNKMRKESHSLKSESGNLGARHFSSLCQSMEDMDDQALSANGEKLIAELSSEYERVSKELQEFAGDLS